MSREAVGILTLALLVLGLLTAMRAGWLRRGRRTAAVVEPPPPVPEDEELGAVRFGPVEGSYVSTTFAGQPFERVTAHGLGVRGRAEVCVHESGVRITRNGAAELFLPATALRTVSRTAGMAGSTVGRGGLVVLTWVLGAQALDTGVRTRFAADRQKLTDAVAALATPDGPTTPTGQENA